MSNRKSKNKNYTTKSQDKNNFIFKPMYLFIILLSLTSILFINSFVNQPIRYNTSHVTFNKDEELKKLEKEFFKTAKNSISSDEEYVYIEMSLIERDVTLAAFAGDLLGPNESKKLTFNLTLNNKSTLKGYDIFSTFNFNLVGETTPTTDRIPFNNNQENGFITHILPVAYLKGHIVEYTYDVYKKNTDEFLRREKVYASLPNEGFIVNHNVQSAELFKIENIEGNNYKVYKNYSDFVSNLNKKIL